MECVMCKGHMEHKSINHIVDNEGHITIVKNVPALVCSQCGESYIGHDVTLRLEELLDKYVNESVEVLIIHFLEKVA